MPHEEEKKHAFFTFPTPNEPVSRIRVNLWWQTYEEFRRAYRQSPSQTCYVSLIVQWARSSAVRAVDS